MLIKWQEKEVANIIKLQIPGGKASPAPPVGPALGGSGVNIMDFVKQFNDRTEPSRNYNSSCYYSL